MRILLLNFFVSHLIVSAFSKLSDGLPKVVPVKQLKEARQKLGSTQNYLSEYPEWLNITLLEIGQRFLLKHYVGYLYGWGLGTLMVGATTDARRIVISAGNT